MAAEEAKPDEADTPKEDAMDTEEAPPKEPLPPPPDKSNLSAPIVSAIPEGDLYATYKNTEGERDFLDVQEKYVRGRRRASGVPARRASRGIFRATPPPRNARRQVKDEIRNLKRELIRAKEEIKRIQSVPLVIGQFNEMVDARRRAGHIPRFGGAPRRAPGRGS